VLQVGTHAVAPKAKVVELQVPLAELAGYDVDVAILHVCAEHVPVTATEPDVDVDADELQMADNVPT